ncbi:phosphoribosylglycinamide formyltransferase [Alkalicella caledoniensis]|uniref:Phosphoribosylglycinamide formyltransferase n=1 Tax=Alkalicella caledoniensis TaxID=2731377 RepID=A0A7G9W990_ALKCA|nr:phosphoribosylglycinamide formyltransferase [Alkalicella caledoniensis]QNO15252.1 phosphoribosylglycinamide formyltransferase [Alkalicella caledoniensis]
MKKIVVFASGEGSNFQVILDNMHSINGKIVALIVDRECKAVKRAELNNIPVVRIIKKQCNDRNEFDRQILKAMAYSEADYFVLAGFMSILSKEVVKKFPNRIINIHPSLLPAFPGVNSVQKALEYGVKYTGCTVHFVDDGVDTGPIIAQRIVPIIEGYTVRHLTEQVHVVEHDIFPIVVKLLCLDRIKVEGRRVKLLQGEEI